MIDLRATLVLLALWALPLPLAGSDAQAPGFAEVTRPVSGEAVGGVVTIEGTANHPSFDHFDLTFTYEADTTGTWFPIVDEHRSRVVEGRLAVWDTTGITDGEYMLRLRVWPAEGEPLVAIVHGLRVRNYTSIETPTPGPALAAPALTPTEAPPTSTPPPPAILPATPEPGNRVGSALIAGGTIAMVVLAATAGYAAWRAASRSNWGSARAIRRAERRRRSRHSL
jgi:hypothetical protein